MTPTQTPNIFAPVSTPALEIRDLSFIVLAITAAIFVIVGGFTIYTLIRFGRRPTNPQIEPAQVYGSTQIELAGKMDAIPNKTNRVWIEPRRVGTYVGQCAEYCGLQHALMLLVVAVHPKDEFRAWVAAQRTAPAEQAAARAGRELFSSLACINCHSVRGTPGNGVFGPDLTHLMSRSTLGAGAVRNTPENLRAWVKDPGAFKAGVLMPAMKLDEAQLDQLLAYLVTLR